MKYTYEQIDAASADELNEMIAETKTDLRVIQHKWEERIEDFEAYLEYMTYHENRMNECHVEATTMVDILGHMIDRVNELEGDGDGPLGAE